ncbi:MAG: RNA-binding protein [Geobacter sp.]
MAKELYIGHLPYEATNDDLRRLFSVAGTVTSVHIITDPVSGKSKGCGYVRMSSEEELQEAIDCLDGALMEGLQITVSIARPQKPQTAGNQPGKPRRKGPAPKSGGPRSAEGAAARKPAPKTAQPAPPATRARPTTSRGRRTPTGKG